MLTWMFDALPLEDAKIEPVLQKPVNGLDSQRNRASIGVGRTSDLVPSAIPRAASLSTPRWRRPRKPRVTRGALSGSVRSTELVVGVGVLTIHVADGRYPG